MPKTLMQSMVDQLQKERMRLEHELRRVTAALTAFGKVYMEGVQAQPAAKKKTSPGAKRKAGRVVSRAGVGKSRKRRKSSAVKK